MLDLQAISEHARQRAEERARLMHPAERPDKIRESTQRLFHQYYWEMVSPVPPKR